MYGSADGGRRMHKKNAVFNESIEKIAQHLYLKPHMASNGQDLIYTPTGTLSSPNNKQFLWLVCLSDLEGHLGHDGRLYALDYSRLFPPGNFPYLCASR